MPADVDARSHGPLSAGHFRVVVYEASSRVTFHDFSARALAERYANDAASETEDGIVLAYVVDSSFRIVHTGKHY